MLKITQEQLEIMGETRLPKFFKEIANYVEKEFPEFHIEQRMDLDSWIAFTYHKAKSYKINTVKNHIKFVNYHCIFGDNFDTRYPFAKKILTSTKTANTKMAELKDAFIDELNREES